MQLKQVMAQLEGAGSEQTRKTYTRQGVKGPQFGVSFGTLTVLTKKIRTNQALAQELWATGNHDARMLATMVADPAACTEALLESWRKDASYHTLSDALAKVAAKSALPIATIERWCDSKEDIAAQLGWTTLSARMADGRIEAGAFGGKLLEKIEKEIHARPNRTRHAMNGVLIAVGIHSEALREQALAAAKRIGKVNVDHGETDCETPDAHSYIEKAVARAKAPSRAGAGWKAPTNPAGQKTWSAPTLKAAAPRRSAG